MIWTVLSLWFFQTGNHSASGYWYFLFSQLVGSVLNMAMIKRLRLTGSPSVRHYTSAVMAGLQLGLTVAAAAFICVLGYDYTEKCSWYKPIESRVFNSAFAFSCNSIWVYLAMGLYCVPLLVTRCFALQGATSEWRRFQESNRTFASTLAAPLNPSETEELSDKKESVEKLNTFGQSDDKTSRVCWGVAFFVLATVTPSFFVKDYEIVGGSCPVVGKTLPPFSSTEHRGGTDITHVMFREKPAKGVEVNECKWRAWQGGTCVKYPFDPKYFEDNRGEVVPERHESFLFSNTNSSDECDTVIGLLNCAIYSPRAGKFVYKVTAERIGMRLCSEWCNEVFDACRSSRCKGTKTPEDCCDFVSRYGVTVVAQNSTECYSQGHHIIPPRFLVWFLFGSVASILV
jgi:hypothetical protein